MSINEILFRRANLIKFDLENADVLKKISTTSHSIMFNRAEILDRRAAFVIELSRLGFLIDRDIFNLLPYVNKDELTEIISIAKKMKGDDVEYSPMYPNFPDQVKNASVEELYVNALFHYLGNFFDVLVLPTYDKDDRPFDSSAYKKTVLRYATDEKINKLAVDLITQGQPFSSQDQADVLELSEFVSEKVDVSVKENLAYVLVNTDLDVSDSMKTLTDVLRVATVLSGGDVSLAENVRFKLSRSQRRFVKSLVLKVLQSNGQNHEDFARFSEQWKRLAKTVHLADGSSPILKKAADVIYKQSAKSFDSFVENALRDEFVNTSVVILSERPGVFARRLHEVLRKFPEDWDYILEEFKKVSNRVSLRVLIQMYDFFSGPKNDVLPKRSISVKSRTANSNFIDNSLEASKNYSKVLEAIEEGFKNRLSDRSFAVDMDEAAQYTIPMENRSAASGMKSIGRGSRIKISDDGKIVRLFQHWKNMDRGSYSWGYDGRVDLDLTAYFMDETFEKRVPITYYNLRDKDLESYHSGDITDAPDGASEFVDVNIEKALEAGYRYVMGSVFNYTRQKLSEVPEAWAGVMVKNVLGNKGEIFDPQTVQIKYDLNTDSSISIPFVLDMKTRELIWVDSSIHINEHSNYNIISNEDTLALKMKNIVHGNRMTVKKLLELTGAEVNSGDVSAEDLDPTSTEQVLGLIV